MKSVEVVAAIIEKDGKYFATQRGYGDFKDGGEFPGGKVEPGEQPEQIDSVDWLPADIKVVNPLKEELGI